MAVTTTRSNMNTYSGDSPKNPLEEIAKRDVRIAELTAQRDRLRATLRDALPISEQEYPSCDFRGKLKSGDLPEDFDPPFWQEVGLPRPTHTPDGDMTGK